MENEINYISEKVESLDNKIAELHDNANGDCGINGKVGDQYRAIIKEMEAEKQMLENIMKALQKPKDKPLPLSDEFGTLILAFDGDDPCDECKYTDKPWDCDVCKKCRKENPLGSYYIAD